MGKVKGVYRATRKDGSDYYRASITFRGKHISLGSFDTEEECHNAYKEAEDILYDSNETIENFNESKALLSYQKRVSLVNFRDNKMYFKTPIFLQKNYFTYHLSPKEILKFDIDDLFFYSTRTIMKRQGHIFVADYGMQVNLPSRYGIKNYATEGVDYYFKNNDHYDFRYENVVVLNKYNGVSKTVYKKNDCYVAKLHVKGNVVIGHYQNEEDAAIAYNKGIDIAALHGLSRNYQKNYIEGMTEMEYHERYKNLKMSRSFYKYLQDRAF